MISHFRIDLKNLNFKTKYKIIKNVIYKEGVDTSIRLEDDYFYKQGVSLELYIEDGLIYSLKQVFPFFSWFKSTHFEKIWVNAAGEIFSGNENCILDDLT